MLRARLLVSGATTGWLGALIFAHSFSAIGAPRDSLHDLLSVYRCEVVHRLEQIYATGDPKLDDDRFLAVTVPEHPHGYVQCMFHDERTAIYCEASSGFYYDEPRTFHQPPETIEALARLGFNMDDSQGNFSVNFSIDTPPDFNAIADFMLRALHDGYRARANTNLQFNAPFAPGVPSTCIPVG